MKKSLGAKIIAFPTPTWVIGTFDDQGKANMMTAAWGGVCCSKPPCVNFSLRKATYTYDCVKAQKAFTVNIPSVDQVKVTDYFGIASGRDRDKIAEAKLTAVTSELVKAPYLDEFPLVLECRLIHAHEIGLHTIFIGEIMDTKAAAEILDEESKPLPEKLRAFTYVPGLQDYRAVGESIGQAFSVGKK